MPVKKTENIFPISLANIAGDASTRRDELWGAATGPAESLDDLLSRWAIDELSGDTLSDGGAGERISGRAAVAADAMETLAPDLCNTGAMTRHVNASSVQTAREPSTSAGVVPRDAIAALPSGKETGGVDTLHVGLYGEWFDLTSFERISGEFDRCRQAAEAGNDEAGIWESPAGDKFQFQASGAKVGIYCRWVAEWNGCRVYFVNRQEACDKTHSIYVQFGSLALMTRGHNQLWSDFCGVLAAMGFKVQAHKISRVDLCTDHAGLGVTEVTKLIFAGHEISKAKKGNLHFGATFAEHETYYRGGERVLLRIYDKLKEVQHDEAKRAVLIDKRWGCEPEKATRVEFQVSRDVLKDRWEIDTLDDLNAKLANLTQWLTSEWYRMAAVPVVDARENNNQSRVATHSLWERVQQAFASWVACDPIEYVVPREKLLPRIDQLAKQARGCIATALALCFKPLDTVAECTAAAVAFIELHAGEVFANAKQRREEFGIHFGPAVASPGGVPF